MREEWKPVVGYGGRYEVSSMGAVRLAVTTRGAKAGTVLARHPNKNGYPRVRVSWQGTRKKYVLVHNLVAAAFLGERPDGFEIDHLDDDKDNAAASNLEYVPHAENMRRAKEAGLRPVGLRQSLISKRGWVTRKANMACR